MGLRVLSTADTHTRVLNRRKQWLALALALNPSRRRGLQGQRVFVRGGAAKPCSVAPTRARQSHEVRAPASPGPALRVAGSQGASCSPSARVSRASVRLAPCRPRAHVSQPPPALCARRQRHRSQDETLRNRAGRRGEELLPQPHSQQHRLVQSNRLHPIYSEVRLNTQLGQQTMAVPYSSFCCFFILALKPDVISRMEKSRVQVLKNSALPAPGSLLPLQSVLGSRTGHALFKAQQRGGNVQRLH